MSDDRYIVAQILDLIDSSGEDEIRDRLSAFSCPINPEVEGFLRDKAIEFSKRKSSITYIVIDSKDAEFIGYFTLTHRPINISNEGLSSKMRNRISNHARLDEGTNEYPLSAFLLAQIGKNYAIDNGSRITGKELIRLAIDTLNGIRHLIGGGVIYLDCEDRPKLRTFYESKDVGFRLFGERVSEMDGIRYLQYMKVL